jgi:hypothetical protein
MPSKYGLLGYGNNLYSFAAEVDFEGSLVFALSPAGQLARLTPSLEGNISFPVLGSGGVSAPSGPATKMLVSYTPGAARNDFDGEVGVRLGIGGAPITVEWVGALCGASGGTRTVKLYEWFADSLQRTATIDMTGKAVGDWAWAAISPITLPANSYYSLLQSVTAYDGKTWANPGATTFNGMANVYATYRIPGQGMSATGVDQQYVGLDIGYGSLVQSLAAWSDIAILTRIGLFTGNTPFTITFDGILRETEGIRGDLPFTVGLFGSLGETRTYIGALPFTVAFGGVLNKVYSLIGGAQFSVVLSGDLRNNIGLFGDLPFNFVLSGELYRAAERQLEASMPIQVDLDGALSVSQPLEGDLRFSIDFDGAAMGIYIGPFWDPDDPIEDHDWIPDQPVSDGWVPVSASGSNWTPDVPNTQFWIPDTPVKPGWSR